MKIRYKVPWFVMPIPSILSTAPEWPEKTVCILQFLNGEINDAELV